MLKGDDDEHMYSNLLLQVNIEFERIQSLTSSSQYRVNIEFESLQQPRRLLQRKCHIKIELCFGLTLFCDYSVLVTFYKTYKQFFFKGKEWKDLLVRARVVIRTSNMININSFADYVKKLQQTACSIFPHSTNQIIDFWRCHCRCLVFSLIPSFFN